MKFERYLKNEVLKFQPGGDDESENGQSGNNEGEGTKLL